MAILNYTTTIDPWKSIHEIQIILAKGGVTNFSIRNELQMPVAVSFCIDYGGTPLNYLLPCNHKGVFSCMKKDKKMSSKYKTEEQALRTSWRIIKDWVEAQMAIVQSELVEIHEVFLSRLIINTTSGETLGARILYGGGLKQLSNG